MSDIHITVHAAERFVQRHRPDLTFKQAMTFLIQNAPQAAPLKERTHRGHQQRVLNDPYCVLVIKHDRAMRMPVCVTILPEPENDDPITEEEMDIIRERLAKDLRGGKPNLGEINKVLYRSESAPKPSLIKPSLDEKAESKRVLLENRLWSKALESYAKHQKEQTRLETHYLRVEYQEDSFKNKFAQNLRRLILSVSDEQRQDLLGVIDKEFLRDDFLYGGKKPNRPKLIQYSRSPCKTGIMNQCTMTTKTWLGAGRICEGPSVDGVDSKTSQGSDLAG